MVVIDVYIKVRPPWKKGEDAYAADDAAVVTLQRYVSEKKLAVVLVTHAREMEAEDPLEAISGTNGVTGCADAAVCSIEMRMVRRSTAGAVRCVAR